MNLLHRTPLTGVQYIWFPGWSMTPLPSPLPQGWGFWRKLTASYHICSLIFFPSNSIVLILKSIPTKKAQKKALFSGLSRPNQAQSTQQVINDVNVIWHYKRSELSPPGWPFPAGMQSWSAVTSKAKPLFAPWQESPRLASPTVVNTVVTVAFPPLTCCQGPLHRLYTGRLNIMCRGNENTNFKKPVGAVSWPPSAG